MNKMRTDAMAQVARVQVLLPSDDAKRFNAYCQRLGFKKSTLIARLVREHLDLEAGRRAAELPNEKRTRGR